MAILRLDHIQIAMPAGGETEARAFYTGVLGFVEVAKPPVLGTRGGCWFESGAVKLHLGVEPGFHPAKKAHPAFLVDDLAGTMAMLAKAGAPMRSDEPLAGYDRVFTEDPFGNRLELMQCQEGDD